MNHDDLEDLLKNYATGYPEKLDEFIQSAELLVFMLKQEMDFQAAASACRKKPSKWDGDCKRLLKVLRELDPRMASHIMQNETNFYGQGSNSLVRLMTLLESGVPRTTPWTQDVRTVCMMLVASFCVMWEMYFEKPDRDSDGPFNQNGFYRLMEIIMPELGVSWDIYKLADVVAPYIARLESQ